MIPTNLSAYIKWRKSIFDPKADCDPTLFAGSYTDLCRAAGEAVETNGLHGRLHHLFRFDDAAGPHLLRVFGNPAVPAYHLHLEDWVAQAAQEVGVSTISATLTDTSRYLVPFDFQILPWVDAKPLAAADEATLNRVIPQVAAQLVKLHQISMRGFGPLDPRPLFARTPDKPEGLFDSWWDSIKVRLTEHVNTCQEIGAITVTEATKILHLFASSDDEMFNFVPSLLHGDLSNVNILYGDHPILIDWENAVSGDPVFDLAQWAAFHMPDRFSHLIDAYYQHVSKPYDFDQRFWLYYLRVVIARTVHRHRFRVADSDKYPPASRRIQIALEHLT